jgi:hypothetical protein
MTSPEASPKLSGCSGDRLIDRNPSDRLKEPFSRSSLSRPEPADNLDSTYLRTQGHLFNSEDEV